MGEYVDALPVHVWRLIFFDLDTRSMTRCMRMCRTWQRSVTDQHWHVAFYKDFSRLRLEHDGGALSDAMQGLLDQCAKPMAAESDETWRYRYARCTRALDSGDLKLPLLEADTEPCWNPYDTPLRPVSLIRSHTLCPVCECPIVAGTNGHCTNDCDAEAHTALSTKDAPMCFVRYPDSVVNRHHFYQQTELNQYPVQELIKSLGAPRGFQPSLVGKVAYMELMQPSWLNYMMRQDCGGFGVVYSIPHFAFWHGFLFTALYSLLPTFVLFVLAGTGHLPGNLFAFPSLVFAEPSRPWPASLFVPYLLASFAMPLHVAIGWHENHVWTYHSHKTWVCAALLWATVLFLLQSGNIVYTLYCASPFVAMLCNIPFMISHNFLPWFGRTPIGVFLDTITQPLAHMLYGALNHTGVLRGPIMFASVVCLTFAGAYIVGLAWVLLLGVLFAVTAAYCAHMDFALSSLVLRHRRPPSCPLNLVYPLSKAPLASIRNARLALHAFALTLFGASVASHVLGLGGVASFFGATLVVAILLVVTLAMLFLYLGEQRVETVQRWKVVIAEAATRAIGTSQANAATLRRLFAELQRRLVQVQKQNRSIPCTLISQGSVWYNFIVVEDDVWDVGVCRDAQMAQEHVSSVDNPIHSH